MKKLLMAPLAALLIVMMLMTGVGAGWDHRGPAPNSGDCYPDGPGW